MRDAASPAAAQMSITRLAFQYIATNMTAEQLRSIIQSGLSCDHIQVEGDGRHWSAVIVSAAFEGLRPVARHQRVYTTLGDRMHTDEVHALSMKTYTPAEWHAR